MKGKKIDTEFLSAFITECIDNNKSSTDEIINEAKSRISSIDQKIKEVEALKVIRCKLLDVVINFEKENDASNKIRESKILSLFNIQNSNICKFICDSIKESSINIELLYGKNYSNKDIIFCIKQLLEYKVICRNNNCLSRGELFDEYLKFVLRK